MFADRKCFSKKVRLIIRTHYPLNAEVILTHTAAHPMKSHVDALGTLNLYGVGS